MTLPAGTRLGPYEILSPLGAGGERAIRGRREVAIKSCRRPSRPMHEGQI